MIKHYLKILFVGFALLSSTHLYSASRDIALIEIDLTQDQRNMQRGAMIYFNNCRLCHDMKYVTYRSLSDIGFSKTQVDKLRGEHILADSLQSTTASDIAEKLFGMVTPDLSLMAKARKGGPDYIYTLLTSYYETDSGNVDNHLFENIKMPDALSYSIALNDEQKASIRNDAKDVVEFLYWASDPHASKRKSMGVYVIAYLLILSGLFYLIMKRVWARLDDVNLPEQH